MKNAVLLSVLFFLLTSVNIPQTNNGRINNPLPLISGQNRETQIPYGHLLKETLHNSINSFPYRKSYEKEVSGGALFRPFQVLKDSSYRYTYTYTDKGMEHIIIGEALTNGIWQNRARITHAYDNSGNELSLLSEVWSGSGWVNSYIYTNTYDNSGNRISVLHKIWQNGSWINLSRYTNTYDNSGNLLEESHEDWTNNAWKMNYRFTYNYDDSGNLLGYLSEDWSGGQWVNSYKTAYVYENNGKKVTRLSERWKSGVWEKAERMTHIYNDYSSVSDYLMEVWSNNAWELSDRASLTYDNTGKCPVNILRETWVTNHFERRLTNYSYDGSGNCIHAECLSQKDSSWTLPAKDYLEMAFNYGASFFYIYAHTAEIEYTQVTAVKEEKINPRGFSLMQNYPNPFNPVTNIKYELPEASEVELTVYDIMGKEVASLVRGIESAGVHTVQFNATGISSGIYLIKLRSGSLIETRKMTVLK